MHSDRIVFLDRDGTINQDHGYVCRPEDVKLVGGAGRAIGNLRRAGFTIAVVTNQSAIGRGKATLEQVEATNARIARLLLEEDADARMDQIYFCPHAPSDNCSCRKPLLGMLPKELCTAAKYGASFWWMVGDKLIDLQFGTALGIPPAHCLLVLTGHGAEEVETADAATVPEPQRILPNLPAAAAVILGEDRNG